MPERSPENPGPSSNPPAEGSKNPARSAPQQENLLLSLGANLFLPFLILTKGDDWLGLNPTSALLLGLAGPVLYGLYDFLARKKVNIFSVLGFVGVLLTGGIALLKLPPHWIAIKEAAVPLGFGVAILATMGLKKPLVRFILMNEQVMDVPKVEQALDERQNRGAFDALLRRSTLLIAASFLLSAILNFLLARWVVKTDPNVDAAAFNDELGRMTALSFPVISIPVMLVTFGALFYLVNGLTKLTGLKLEDLFHAQADKERA